MSTFSTIQGTIIDFRYHTLTTTVTSIYNNGSRYFDTYVEHTATFITQGKTIQLSIRDPIHLAEGNEVLLVGEFGTDGVFHACAYKNLLTGAIGRLGFHKTGKGEILTEILPYGGMALTIFGLVAFVLTKHGLGLATALAGVPFWIVGFLAQKAYLAEITNLNRTINRLLGEN